MADANLRLRITAHDAAHSTVHGFLGGLGGAIEHVGLLGEGLRTGFEVVKGAAEGLIGPFMESQRVSAQTDAVLRSTGGAAGLTAGDIEDLAQSLAKVTPFEDELVKKTENMLLTFTSIGKDIFPQATEAALNMATALGRDPVDASIMLGKALNDPVRGMTALRRVGVQFTDEQMHMVKAMMASGHQAEAQALILKELETEFGNSARAAGETFAGKLVILQTQLGNVMEVIGGPVVAGLTFLLDKVTPLATAFAEELPNAIDALSPLFNAISEAADAVGPRLESLAQIAKTALGGDFAGALDGLRDLLEADIVPSVTESLQGLGEWLMAWIGDMAPTIADQFTTEWFPAFWAWINDARLKLLEEEGHLLAGLLRWIGEAAPPLLETFISEWVPAFIAWVLGTALPELVKVLAQLVVGIVKFLIEVVPELDKTAAKLGEAMITGILKGLENLKGKLSEWLKDMAGNALNVVKQTLGISSPSARFAKEIGEPIVEGIMAGIESQAAQLTGTLTVTLGDAAAAAVPAAAAAGTAVGNAYAEAMAEAMAVSNGTGEEEAARKVAAENAQKAAPKKTAAPGGGGGSLTNPFAYFSPGYQGGGYYAVGPQGPGYYDYAPPRRAGGGPVQAGMRYTVGEEGSETFVPNRDGTIMPHGGESGGEVHNHIYLTPGGAELVDLVVDLMTGRVKNLAALGQAGG